MGTSTSDETRVEIRIWQEHWECGDGCCSASWWKAEIEVDGRTLFDADSDCYHSRRSIDLEVIHKLQKVFT